MNELENYLATLYPDPKGQIPFAAFYEGFRAWLPPDERELWSKVRVQQQLGSRIVEGGPNWRRTKSVVGVSIREAPIAGRLTDNILSRFDSLTVGPKLDYHYWDYESSRWVENYVTRLGYSPDAYTLTYEEITARLRERGVNCDLAQVKSAFRWLRELRLAESVDPYWSLQEADGFRARAACITENGVTDVQWADVAQEPDDAGINVSKTATGPIAAMSLARSSKDEYRPKDYRDRAGEPAIYFQGAVWAK